MDLEPELIISAPLDPLGSSSSNKQHAGDGDPKKTLLARLFDLFKNACPGSDLTRFQVPAQFNMPKSQLQLYGESVYACTEDLLGACAKGPTPLLRFLRVVAWHISTTRLAPFAQAPFNPILGETHHASFGRLDVFLEQVSHHPPISALYATKDDDELRLQWWHSPCPRFYGNRVEVTVQGKRELWLDSHKELYETTCPKLCIRFFPSPGNEWVGTSVVKCSASSLEANLLFKAKSFFSFRGSVGQISGHIVDTSTRTTLFHLFGSYNRSVTIRDVKTGETTLLFDALTCLSNLKAPIVQSRMDVKGTESVLVWRAVMDALRKGDWDAARKAKNELEERQRTLAKQRKQEGKAWVPQHFELIDGKDWQWRHTGESVTQAPLVIP